MNNSSETLSIQRTTVTANNSNWLLFSMQLQLIDVAPVQHNIVLFW